MDQNIFSLLKFINAEINQHEIRQTDKLTLPVCWKIFLHMRGKPLLQVSHKLGEAYTLLFLSSCLCTFCRDPQWQHEDYKAYDILIFT